jgi:hypothetical protein
LVEPPGAERAAHRSRRSYGIGYLKHVSDAAVSTIGANFFVDSRKRFRDSSTAVAIGQRSPHQTAATPPSALAGGVAGGFVAWIAFIAWIAFVAWISIALQRVCPAIVQSNFSRLSAIGFRLAP